MKLFLDDERPCPYGWTGVKYPQEAINILNNKKVSVISLDHDLGDDEKIGTGYDVLLWIEERVYTDIDYVSPKINIHTTNPSAKQKMEMAVKNINKLYKGK